MKKRILLVGNEASSVYSHRQELIGALLKNGFEVTVTANDGREAQFIREAGCKYIDLKLQRKSKNPLTDLKLFFRLRHIIKQEKPDIILTFYTKTNIWGGLAALSCRIPYLMNITGLGMVVENGGLLGKLTFALYKLAASSAANVFFQNMDNLNFFLNQKVHLKNYVLIPGSGVSLDRFHLLPYPDSKQINFTFISRVVKEKGIDEVLEAAEVIKSKHLNVIFNIVGPAEGEYKVILEKMDNRGIIDYHGPLIDISPILKRSHCIVFPSYYGEGMANVLLEGAASGRPIITTARPGCGETVEDEVTGFIVKEKDASDLIRALNKFLALSYQTQKKMGEKGRKKMENEFDRNIVTRAYLDCINTVLISSVN